jgi:membrane protein YqaA with SNARE-associated domain
MTDVAIYAGLFFSAFLAATLIPGSSEVLLVGLLSTGRGEPWVLLAVATVGNVMGSCANWVCGRFLARFKDRKWFPVSPRRYDQAIAWYGRYGLWSLLLAWVPIIGDPLSAAAGALRVPFVPFLAVVTAGKAARYMFVYSLVSPHFY